MTTPLGELVTASVVVDNGTVVLRLGQCVNILNAEQSLKLSDLLFHAGHQASMKGIAA